MANTGFPFSRLAPPCFIAAAVSLVGIGLGGCAQDKEQVTAPSDQQIQLFSSAAPQSDLDRALAVHRRHTMRLITLPGVVGTAVGLSANRRPAIKIYTARGDVVGLPSVLEDIPVVVEVTGEFHPDVCTPGTCTNTDIWPSPVPIGISTGNVGRCSAGTIGGRLKAGSTVYALSNNHIYALENTAPLGSNVLQPGLVDLPQCSPDGANVLGTLFAFASITFCSGNSCPNNTMDAAIAISDVTKLDNKTPPAGYGTPLSAWWPATLGLPVQKYGRTTSLTTGQVTGIDATVTVGPYGNGLNARFVNQTIIGNCPNVCSGPGDSGSLWVTNDASAEPMGLNFAGSGTTAVANQIGNVLTYFGVSVDGNPAPTATGGLAAWCDAICPDYNPYPTITAVTAAGGNTITVTDGAGHTDTITLSGATASGGLAAWCDAICPDYNPYPTITAVTAAGGHTITVTDGAGHTGTITLSGATASGGLTAWCDAMCPGRPWPNITAVTASAGSNAINVRDGAGHTSYVKVSF